MSEITQAEMVEALDRIAMTSDGARLYRYLQKVLCGMAREDAKRGALLRNEGRRMFAAELMALMAQGVRTHGTDDHTILTFAVAGPKPRAESGRGAGRRITADTPIPGWDRPDTP